MPLRWIGLLLFLLAACTPPAPGPAPTAEGSSAPGQRLVVAWVEGGNLMVWSQGEELPRRVASGGVVQPFIAPDGRHIAFTRGPGGRPETLWVVDLAGRAEQMLAGGGTPRSTAGALIADVGWLDGAVLYFNTAAQSPLGLDPHNNLYRANIRTREVALLLGPGRGGRFVISPDRQRIALVYPGTYGRQDGRISVTDPLARIGPRSLLFFVGVATGAEYAFYPELHWLPDSSALLVAIPHRDLIYSETEPDPPLTQLWRLPADNPGGRTLLGGVRASFFGLPRWSDEGGLLLYMQRVPGSNSFRALAALANGDEPAEYATGEAGALEPARWLPGEGRFVYTQGSAGTVWLGSYGMAPQRLTDEVAYRPLFVSAEMYVFITPQAMAADGFQMRYAQVGQASQPIGPAGSALPVFDAVLAPAG